MIVIYRNGVPTVITGWRAWLIMLGGALAFVVIMGLVLGVAGGRRTSNLSSLKSGEWPDVGR